MSDENCVSFLQWALPRLGMRWKGFRKVRRQVCRRIRRRMAELGLSGFEAYRKHLKSHPDEWERLGDLCRVTISRFRRDHGLWRKLENEVLPELIANLASGAPLRAWSAGCASGEEPYTLSIIWRMGIAPHVPLDDLQVVATDVDPQVLERAREACYSHSSLKELEPDRVKAAFSAVDGGERRREGNNGLVVHGTMRGTDIGQADRAESEVDTLFRLRDEYREGVTFLQQNLLQEMPAGPFHLILCRNLVFTYFGEDLQCRVLENLLERLAPGGALVVGGHEALPDREPPWPLERWTDAEPIYRHESSRA